jgi:hypothetical protein
MGAVTPKEKSSMSNNNNNNNNGNNNNNTNIIKDTCRKSQNVQHITGALRALTQSDNTNCQNPVANIVPQELGLNSELPKGKPTLYTNTSHNLC